MKNKILVMLVASVLCIAFIGGCFALYIINAEEKNITLTTGNSISLTWGGNTSLDATVNPDNDTTTWTLELTTTEEVSDTSKYGKFSLTFGNGISSMLEVATTIDDQPYNYTKEQLANGVYFKLNGLSASPLEVTFSFTFTGEDADWESWAERVATVTANWVIDESYTGSWEPVAGWYLVGNINGTESWAVHTDGENALYKFTEANNSHYATPEDIGVNNNRAWLEDVQLKAGDTIKILRYYLDNEDALQSAWEGNFRGVSGTGYGDMRLDGQGNFIANLDGYYSIYVNHNWEIYVSYSAQP
ncbi:MAG: hypothetical protein IJV78_00355 [Clostridia bacterium]|nr:hypothetical protein [Clostridia bacterium]MBQ9706326.1 hypothetical protein [Clostridia bacterium]